MSTLRENILEKSKNSKKLIVIRTGTSEEDMSCGYVCAYSENHIWLQQFNFLGEADGVALVKMQDVETVEWNTEIDLYCQYLIQNPLVKTVETIDFPEIDVEADNWQHEMLKHFQSDKSPAIMLKVGYRDYIYGFVRELDEEFFVFQKVSDAGIDEGYFLYSLSEIETFEVNNIEAKRRTALYDWRNGNGKRAPM
ncbi:MAG: hypothetical protein ACKVTZ_24090 [Bacteroidia bacterium]